ncbi:DUF4922 domain-containing protein [Melioribacteraceae bacterium 4301-Me]|uniref:DUF4922 domain-containing protein n=1 Tax=Pyranulibacter aquaticus TaxID=3163344 RepID=UPI0035963C0A
MIKKIIDIKNLKTQNNGLFSEAVKNFFYIQLEKWDLLKQNIQNLKEVKTKEFNFGLYDIIAQFNPARIKSTTAAVDKDSIENRKCFLCLDNLPAEQIALPYEKNYLILCNPYPIFPEHFTIVRTRHKPQTIVGAFGDLLNLTKDLSKYFVVFYNGPQCGASAPDHMHFQAATNGIMPLEKNYYQIKQELSTCIFKNDKLEIYCVEKYPAKFFLFESDSKGELLYAFKIFFNNYRKISSSKPEPMFNILSKFEKEKWHVFIFPRLKHRPTYYFEKNENNFAISPAAVDLSGLLIVPRENDFNRLTSQIVLDVYKQVTLTTEYFEYLKKKLKEVFAAK